MGEDGQGKVKISFMSLGNDVKVRADPEITFPDESKTVSVRTTPELVFPSPPVTVLPPIGPLAPPPA